MIRCPWCESNPLLQGYHDEEWGKRPCSEEKHFEFLMLECAQAGLSWMTVLKRREAYRLAFAGFDAKLVAAFGDSEMEAMLQNPLLIRNRQKLSAALKNAKAFSSVQKAFGSFDAYLLSFFGGRPLVNNVADDHLVPAWTEVSKAISEDMKARGFYFMGATVVYAHLQAAGIVDDHVNGCFCKAIVSPIPVESLKLKTLQKVGRALKASGVRFCVGGSAMLYRNGLVEQFNDIDLLVESSDAYKAETVLLSIGQSEEAKSSTAFVTDIFRSFLVDGIGVDMMAGLKIRSGGQVYSHQLTEGSYADRWPVWGEVLPFSALEEWCVLYHLMPGKAHKAELIKAHLKSSGQCNLDFLASVMGNGVPPAASEWLNDLMSAKSREIKS